jgi:hypothetical protein
MAAIDVRGLGEHSAASKGSRLQKALFATVTTAAGIALVSCSALQPPAAHSSTSPMVYEPLAPITRAPLSPPAGYASPSPLAASPTTRAPYANSLSEGAGPQTAEHGEWRASPRWAAVEGDGCIVVEQVPQHEAAAAPEATKFRVENCSKEETGEPRPTRPNGLNGNYSP